jgi:hypothetical protein
MSKWFCYRWLPRTIIPNISWAIHTFNQGVKNIFKWLPVVFFDRWYDYSYLVKIMQFKIHDMYYHFENYGHFIGNKKTAKQMLICSILLKRIEEDNYFKNSCYNVKKSNYSQSNDMEYLFKIMNKHLLAWWD